MLQARSGCLPIRAAAAMLCTALHSAALRCTGLMRSLYKFPGFINIFFLDLRGLTENFDLSDAIFYEPPGCISIFFLDLRG